MRQCITRRFVARQDALGCHAQAAPKIPQHGVEVLARDLQRVGCALDGPYPVHVVQLEHAPVECIGLAQVGKVQGHDLRAVGSIRPARAHGLGGAAHLAEDVDVVGRRGVEAPRAAPADPALAQVIEIAVFDGGCGLLIVCMARCGCSEAECFGVVLVFRVHQIPRERMRRPMGAGWWWM